jgi:nicotinamide riboside kinase
LGAECTGKTTLAQALATQMSGLWVPEYLRMFCDQHGRTPRQNEQAHILDMQVRQEEEALAIAEQQRRAYLFCDTAPLLTAIYSDAVLGDHTLYPQARALHARYALTLHLAPDIPWVADGLQRDLQVGVCHCRQRLSQFKQLATHCQQCCGRGRVAVQVLKHLHQRFG